jgi:hypothetical protein
MSTTAIGLFMLALVVLSMFSPARASSLTLTPIPSWVCPTLALVSWSPVAMISRFSRIAGRPMRV